MNYEGLLRKVLGTVSIMFDGKGQDVASAVFRIQSGSARKIEFFNNFLLYENINTIRATSISNEVVYSQ